jgi:hypothetical protein
MKKLILALALLGCIPLQARFADGFVIGGFAGLTTALIASAAAQNCCPRRVVVYERPTYVVERPCYQVVETPVVVEQAPPKRVRRKVQPQVVEKTITETTTTSNDDRELEKRRLALEEQKIELALIKEKKALIEAEIRQKELSATQEKTVTKTVSVAQA